VASTLLRSFERYVNTFAFISYLKYVCASIRVLSGSLASDHITTDGLFLSLLKSSVIAWTCWL